MIEFLKKMSLFENLGQQQLNKVVSIGKTIHVKKGVIVIQEEDVGTTVFLIISGSVKIYKTKSDGKISVMKVAKTGEMFAEVILFERPNYPASAESCEDCTLFTINKQDFLNLLCDQSFNYDFITSLMRRFRYLTNQLHALSTMDIEERFVSYLKNNYGVKEEYTITISKKEFAQMIGTIPETFSRLITKLKKRELIDWNGDRLNVRKKLFDILDL